MQNDQTATAQSQSEVSRRIFEVLDDRRISVSEFARMLGISQGAVSGWKNRGSAPSVELISRICVSLGVSIEWLLTGKETGAKNSIGSVSGGTFVQGVNRGTLIGASDQQTQKMLSPEASELLRIYESIDIKRKLELLGKALEIEENFKKPKEEELS